VDAKGVVQFAVLERWIIISVNAVVRNFVANAMVQQTVLFHQTLSRVSAQKSKQPAISPRPLDKPATFFIYLNTDNPQI
jgi:hypothetical protein